jgi:hypothetical protein
MAQAIRFLLDEDMNPEVAVIGRGLGLDVVSVHEIDRRGFADEAQLRFAVGEGRIVVTRNRDDFIRLTLSLYEAGEVHHGVLIVPHSLPNNRPEHLAHALVRWSGDRPGDPSPNPNFIDFLKA